MNFSKKWVCCLSLVLSLNLLTSSIFKMICSFWNQVLFVYFGMYFGISSLITLVILFAIMSIVAWEIIKRIKSWRYQKIEEMELAEREAEEFFYQMQYISVDAEEQLLKTAIREIVSDILLEKNIINGEQLEQQVSKMLEEIRKDSEIDELQLYMVVKLAVQEAMKELKIA